jgi:hypothetical protein
MVLFPRKTIIRSGNEEVFSSLPMEWGGIEEEVTRVA